MEVPKLERLIIFHAFLLFSNLNQIFHTPIVTKLQSKLFGMKISSQDVKYIC